MPPVSIPYARSQPFDNDAYVRAMSELMLQRNQAAAAATLARGQNSQQMWSGLGNLTMATMAQIGNQHDEQQKLRALQAERDRDYAIKLKEMEERRADRQADLDWRNQQFREGQADKAIGNMPVDTIVPQDVYDKRFKGTSAESAFTPQQGIAARLPATPVMDAGGFSSYVPPATPSGGIPRFATPESATPSSVTPQTPAAGGVPEDYMLPYRRSMSTDTEEVPEGQRRIASQSELMQLKTLQRQAEAAAAAAENMRGDNAARDAAAKALAEYRAAQLKLSSRRAAAAEQNAGSGGTPAVIQTPNGWALVDKGSGQARPVVGTDGKPMERYADTSALGDYRNAFDSAISKVSPMKRTPYINTAERLMAEGNTEELKSYIKKTVLDNVGVDMQNQAIGRAGAVTALAEARGILTDLKKSGLPTGILSGTVEDVVRKLGETSDPSGQYVKLATRLGVALQNYRRSMTGVAFGEGENREYVKQWPSYMNSLPVNLAQIDGLLGAFNAYDKSFWRLQLGPSADKLFGAMAPPADTSKPTVGRDANGNLVSPTKKP